MKDGLPVPSISSVDSVCSGGEGLGNAFFAVKPRAGNVGVGVRNGKEQAWIEFRLQRKSSPTQ